jgi:hypothetical protein
MRSGLPFFFLPPSALPLAAALRVVVFSFGMLTEEVVDVWRVKLKADDPSQQSWSQ